MLMLVALSAVIFPFIFLVLLRMPAIKGMILSSVIVLLFAATVWGMGGAGYSFFHSAGCS